MKTSEFIEKIKKLGYIVDDESSNKSVYVCDEERNAIVMVNTKEMYILDTYWDGFRRLSNENKRCLLNVVLEYIKTPIEEREKPEKYYLRLPGKYHHGSVLNYVIQDDRYMFGDKEEIDGYKTKFTLEEISNLPNQDFVQSLEKELVE